MTAGSQIYLDGIRGCVSPVPSCAPAYELAARSRLCIADAAHSWMLVA